MSHAQRVTAMLPNISRSRAWADRESGEAASTARDSVCLQCHLEGDAAIYRAGESLAAYRPGEDLARFVVYFVDASRAEDGGRATSQYEALLRSACKRASGDKLTCTTCHDPHGSPTAAERVGFYRGKCLACHTGEKMATEHHPEQQDCAVCHMPTRQTTDVSHEQLTDHDIERVPGKARVERISVRTKLIPVGGVSAGDRELGLAYAQFAERGNQQAGEKALALLRKAEAEGANDAESHVRLGFLEQVSGHPDEAQREYQAAWRRIRTTARRWRTWRRSTPRAVRRRRRLRFSAESSRLTRARRLRD